MLVGSQAGAPEIVTAACIGDAEHIARAARGGEILDLYAEGHDLNMNRFDSEDSTQTCFPPDNWARLQQLKMKYDPHKLVPASGLLQNK